ncbi:unnamed protein product [Haemonchus placei]|uniref:HIG1 domain-containing protein n=1 Tax=Haemonchus placei TaxID=6290 RepID=A0A0N4WQB3_HAEPC|nr:unnamed protein product [Haemonchus placei]
MKRDYPTIKEYADAQNELGSCMPEFRSAVSKAVKFGASAGVPFGIYVAYRHHGWKLKPLAGKSVAVWFATTLTFGAIGVMTGTYCCLRVNM